jgi:hypothetical protein
MAFTKRLAGTGTYKWRATIKTPVDVDTYDTATMTLVFKRQKASDTTSYKGDRDFLRSVIVGWEDYNDENGKPIPFSRKELDELLEDEFFIIGASESYTASLRGAREKN